MREERQMKLSLIAALLLIGAASAASAQTYWTYRGCSLKERGYYGTPMVAVPNFMPVAAGISTDTVPPIA